MASVVPHWVFVVGGAFWGGAAAVLGQASWAPELEAAAAGDFRGALVKSLPVLVSAALGGVAALVTLAKKWAPPAPAPTPPSP